MIAQPFGSLASGFLTEPLGRKRALICVNLPYAIGWVLLYYADTLATIYAAFTLLGLGIGLMEGNRSLLITTISINKKFNNF